MIMLHTIYNHTISFSNFLTLGSGYLGRGEWTWCGPMGSSILMDSLDRLDPSLLLVPVVVAVPLLPSAWYPVEEDVTEELDRELALSVVASDSLAGARPPRCPPLPLPQRLVLRCALW